MESNERVVPSFEPLDDGRGIEVVDPVERRRLPLYGVSTGDLEVGCDDRFVMPVDIVGAFHAERIRLDDVVDVVVRDGDGKMVTQVEPLTESDLPAGEHLVELNGPIKVYLLVESALTVSSEADGVTIEFPRTARIRIGARSYHRRPAATITTPGDPEAMATAVSMLGSALKTTSPERAYPTLRGHPPAIELGEELHVPSGLSAPESGVTIEVSGAYESLYAVAPLAYYLGARVRIGDRPRIVTDTGFVHPLGGGDGNVEGEVERVLKQAFFFDCVTRTEGYYRIPLRERAAIEPTTDLDFERLYDQSLPRRLEAYLEVPHETIEPHVPTWNVIAHVPPTADRIEVLPHVIDDLALVRSSGAQALSPTNVRAAVLTEYFDGKTRSNAGAGAGRSARSGRDESEGEQIVQIAETESMEDAWFGASAPLNATKAHPQAYRHRLERTSREWPIDIAVVCNDREMEDEHDIADAVYGSHHAFPFEVTLHWDLTVDELGAVCTDEVDFLHYIGHTTADGFDCRDGRLDAATLDAVGVEMFFLNSCRSYRQGLHLIEAGAVGGVVTLSEINERGAATVGRTMAELLNRGFPLRAALQIAARTSVVGGQYIAVGDGTADLSSAENGIPLVCRVDRVDGHRYDVAIQVFLPREGGMGTTVYPLLESNDQHFLAPGIVDTFRVSGEELGEYLTWHPVPVVFEGDLILEDQIESLEL